MSSLQQVIGRTGPGTVTTEDLDGARHQVSLLALGPPDPVEGDWLVVHSGYAVERADGDDAAAASAELRSVRAGLETPEAPR